MATPRMAPAPQSSRLSASSVRRSAPVLAPSAARMASSPSRRTDRARIRFATFEHAMTKISADAASSTSSTVRAGDDDLIAQADGVDAEVARRRIRLGMLLDDRAVDRPQLGARRLELDAGREPAEELRHPMHPAILHRRRRWCGLVTTLAMISVSAGYGTDGSRTPTMVAVRSPSRTVLPMTDGSLWSVSLQKRYVSTAAPAAARPVVGGPSRRPSTGLQAHDLEVRAPDDARAHHARLAEADHRELDRGEVAERAERADARARSWISGHREDGVLERRCPARSGGCR